MDTDGVTTLLSILAHGTELYFTLDLSMDMRKRSEP